MHTSLQTFWTAVEMANMPHHVWRKTVPLLFSPEVVQELREGVDSPCQRHDDVEDHRRRLHRCAPDLHQGAEGPEERDVAEAAGVLFGEEELVERAFVSLGPVQP